jgi:L-ascorbate metabolism protein UlaG (beta-lactamase superfamily)
MQFTYYGHSCFAVVIDGVRLLFDPFITGNPKAGHIDVNSIEADYILITHGHGDHLADAAAIATRTGAVVISNYEIASWLANQGVSKTHAKYVVAVHSSTLPDGSPGGNPGGFVVTSGTHAFYYAGDTALTYDMKLISDEFDLNFAVLPIGDTFTMGIADAVRAADFVGAKTVVGVHYDTFPPIAIDRDEAVTAFGARGVTLLLPAIGETVAL